MNKILKYWSIGFGVFMAFLAVFGWFYDKGGIDKDIESRTHKTVEQLNKNNRHVNNAPTEVQEMYLFVLDSIEKNTSIIEKNDRIKTRATRLKREKYKDSVLLDRDLRNADQFFQMRQLIDSLMKQKSSER